MTSKSNITRYGLLPNSFKKLGILLLVGAIVGQAILLLLHIPMNSNNTLFQILVKTGFLLGLLFVAWSEDKTEDEMSIVLRLKSISFSFLSIVFFVLFKPFADILFNQRGDIISGYQLTTLMLIGYLLMYHFKKLGR